MILVVTQTRTYSLVVEPQEGGYLAYFPALPGCHTWGKTFEEAVKNAEEALAVYIETRAAHSDEIPDETNIKEPVSLGVTVRTPRHSLAYGAAAQLTGKAHYQGA